MTDLTSLYQGAPPPATTSPIVSQQGLPDWYQQYLQGIAAQGTNVAQNASFTGQEATVAPLTINQQNAINATAALQGSQTPGINQAMGYTGNIVPAANTAAAAANAAIAPQANTFTGANVSQYMSPYTNQVVQGLINSSNQNLFNNILPNVNGTFIGAGQFGSTRNADVLGQNINQYETNLNSQIANTLNQGYVQGGQQFTQDQAQRLQQQQAAANTAIQGGQLQATSNQAAGQQTGALTQMNNNISLQNIGALSAAGQVEQAQNQAVANANQQNAIAASNFPWTQLNNLSGLVRGQQLPTTTTGVSAGPAPNYSPSPLAQAVQALGLQTAGAAPTIA